MTARQALREEIDTLKAKREKIDAKLKPLEEAYKVLGGGSANATGPAYRRQNKGPRVSAEQRKVQILDLLRAAPDEEFTPARLKAAYGIPNSSARVALDALVEEGKVKLARRADSGVPHVKHQPTRVRPGEGVAE